MLTSLYDPQNWSRIQNTTHYWSAVENENQALCETDPDNRYLLIHMTISRVSWYINFGVCLPKECAEGDEITRGVNAVQLFMDEILEQ